MHPFINTGVNAARQAGRFALRSLEFLDRIEVEEKNPKDYVSDVDRQCEQLIVDILKTAYPAHGINGEECGELPGDNPDYEWIIDPIDGTTNYLHDLPHFCISIAVKIRGKISHGIIYDPIRDDLFTASIGQGAFLNDHRIRVSKQRTLEGSLVGTGFPLNYTDDIFTPYLKSFESIAKAKVAGIRRAGAAALDLAYVACGRLDGFWETRLKLCDYAAGMLMVKEAGGIVGDFQGGENFEANGEMIAANPKVFKELIRLIRPCF